MQLELVNQESSSHHTVIQVVGIGGGGSNAVQRMVEYGLEGVLFTMANTDLQALERFQSPKMNLFPLGEKITGGLGAGGNPEVGREAAEEDQSKIEALIADAHMVFITAGMGGGTGTGAAPVVASIAKKMNKLCVAVVTTPFHFEGQRKYQLAMQGVEALRKEVDTLIVIPNQLLFQVLEPGTSVREAFANADEVLRMGVKGIADLITQPGDINVDFNDVCTVMRGGGEALMGIGISSGEDRALRATIQALENPLLSGSRMKGATGLLIQITADETFSLEEYNCIMTEVNEYVDTVNATVISGIAIDSNKKDELKVTVIATGFHTEAVNEEQIAKQPRIRTQPPRRQLEPELVAAQAPVQTGTHDAAHRESVTGLESPLSTPLQHSPQARRGGGVMANRSSADSRMVSRMDRYAANPETAPQALNSGSARTAPLEPSQPWPVNGGMHQRPEAGQAAQMRQSLQKQAPPPPERVYRLNERDNRLAEEQAEQVSNTELQLLFSQADDVGHGDRDGVKLPSSASQIGRNSGHKRGSNLGQHRVEPQLPPGQNEDLYVPTLLRRRQSKQ